LTGSLFVGCFPRLGDELLHLVTRCVWYFRRLAQEGSIRSLRIFIPSKLTLTLPDVEQERGIVTHAISLLK